MSYPSGYKQQFKAQLPNCQVDGGLWLDRFTDESLREAVGEWFEDEEAATVKYGHVKNWDTSMATELNLGSCTTLQHTIGDISALQSMQLTKLNLKSCSKLTGTSLSCTLWEHTG